MTDKLNCNVQSSFETFVDKYLNLERAQKLSCVPFFMVHLVVQLNRLPIYKPVLTMIIKGFFPFGFDYDDGVEGNNSSIDPNQKFFVLGKFQDWFFTSSLVVCILGTFFSGITAVVFLTKEHKQSKDIYACALSTVDVMCNLSGVLFTLNQGSSNDTFCKKKSMKIFCLISIHRIQIGQLKYRKIYSVIILFHINHKFTRIFTKVKSLMKFIKKDIFLLMQIIVNDSLDI